MEHINPSERFTYLEGKVTKRERKNPQKKELLHLLAHSKIAVMTKTEPTPKPGAGNCFWVPHTVEGPKLLNSLLMISQVCRQGVGWKVRA